MSDGTLLKVALGTLEYYEAAEKQAGSIKGCAKPSEYLTKLAKYSSLVLRATCYYYMGKQAHSDNKHGLKVACLRASMETLTKERLKKIQSKFRFDALKTLATSTFQNSSSLFEEYYRQNTSVYYEREPEVGELVFLAGRSLVKVVPFALPESGMDRDTIAKRLELLKRNSIQESDSPTRSDSQANPETESKLKENDERSFRDASLVDDRDKENDTDLPSAPSQLE